MRRVSNTLRFLNLPVSASVEQATAVNHTCSFTDACVGGSESKITERLCVSVYVARGFLCLWQKNDCKKKEDGNDV